MRSAQKKVFGNRTIFRHARCAGQPNTPTHARTHAQIQETNIHALSGIRNLDPSNRVAADYTVYCTATVYPFLEALAKMRKWFLHIAPHMPLILLGQDFVCGRSS